MILDGNQMKECGRGFGYEDFWVVFFLLEKEKGVLGIVTSDSVIP